MRRPLFNDNWSRELKLLYQYDTLEFYDVKSNPGYSYSYHNRFYAVIDLIKTYLPVGSKILDIAAAQGNFSITLAEMGYQVVWNDLRIDIVDYVKSKYEYGSITYCPGNCFDLSFPHLFDGIVITEIIEHVAHPDDFLKKLSTLIKPGGYIFLSTPLGNYIRNKLPKFSDSNDPSQYESIQFKPDGDGHIFLLHADELKQLASNVGLATISLKVINNILTSGHLKLRVLLRFLPKRVIDLIENITRKLPLPVAVRIHRNMVAVLKKELS